MTRAKIRVCLAAWLCSVSFWEYLFEANKAPTIPIYQGVDELNELSCREGSVRGRNRNPGVVFPTESGEDGTMSEELTAAVQTPESLSTTVEEQGCEPEIVESFQALAAAGRILRQDSITDYAVAVLAEQIETLRITVNGVDGQYAINVRGRKIKFKDRVAYVAVREKTAARIADLVGSLREIRSEYPTTRTDPSQVNSWNPDAGFENSGP